MAPTIIVGDDESAGDVAFRLLELADNQRHVKTRTDLGRPAFTVPDYLYLKHVGRGKRSVEEQRENAVEQAGADDPDAPTGDDLPPGAQSVDPATLDEELGANAAGDPLPKAAVNVDPPSNGEFPDNGSGRAMPADAPAPGSRTAARKAAARKPRKRTPAKATSSPASGAGEEGA